MTCCGVPGAGRLLGTEAPEGEAGAGPDVRGGREAGWDVGVVTEGVHAASSREPAAARKSRLRIPKRGAGPTGRQTPGSGAPLGGAPSVPAAARATTPTPR